MQKAIRPATKNIIAQKLSMPLCRQYFDKYIFIYITLKQINNGLHNNFSSNTQRAINCNCSVHYITDNSVAIDSVYFAFLSGQHYILEERPSPGGPWYYYLIKIIVILRPALHLFFLTLNFHYL